MRPALSFAGGRLLSYVADISAAGVQPTSYLGAGAQQSSSLASDPVFADLLAAQLDARMMSIAMSDGDTAAGSGIMDTGSIAQAVLLGALLDSAGTAAQQQTVPSPAPEPEAQETTFAAADNNDIVDITPSTRGGLQVTAAYAGPSVSVTTAYAGPSLSSAIDAYSQFDFADVVHRSAEESQAARELAAEFALERQGDPYSQSLRGVDNYVDCSYLTKWAYRQVGMNLPATAAEQARYCVQNGFEIPASDLQKGDLIFWQKKGCGCGRYDEIHHVGVYIGDGRIVEASSSRGQVVVNSMWGDDGIGSWRIAMCARPQ